MSPAKLVSLIESASHPNATALYQRLGIEEEKISTMRKAISRVKNRPIDWLVAEFFYGFGNNYAGVNVSNLDTLLATLQRYSPTTRVIVMVSKEELQYVDKLASLFPLHAVLQSPVNMAQLEQALHQ